MGFDLDSLREQIPYYLNDESKKSLLTNLRALREGQSIDLFLSEDNNDFQNQMLQGDGWRGFELFSFEGNKKVSVFGIVVSNTCDVSPENKRDLATRVTFAPLVKLAKFQQLLKESKISSSKIANKIKSIKLQTTSNIFFIPAGGPLKEDYIVRLDDIYSIPLKCHQNHPDRKKLFTLNDLGFYLFVFKLSVHFCRLFEQIDRQNNS